MRGRDNKEALPELRGLQLIYVLRQGAQRVETLQQEIVASASQGERLGEKRLSWWICKNRFNGALSSLGSFTFLSTPRSNGRPGNRAEGLT
jgi:hypothetical protein